MECYVFVKKGAVLGLMCRPSWLVLTQEHRQKLANKGISVSLMATIEAHHDGDINRVVDTLIESI